MKVLKFTNDLSQKIVSGEKRSTWRLFDDKDLKIGDDLILVNSETGEQFGFAKITSLIEKTIGELTNEDMHGKYSSKDEMYASLGKYYENIDDDTTVKLIGFDFQSKPKKLVLFDFDGVLVNTADLCYKIHQDANSGLTKERYKELTSYSWEEVIEKLRVEEGYKRPPDFDTHYENGLITLSIHDILLGTISVLTQKYILAIVSSSMSSSIRTFLEKEKAAAYFKDVLGSDVHISKVKKIKMILEREGVAPVNVVFITDTLGDIRDATECGVKTIAVTWGFQERETLQKGNPAAILDNPAELLETIEKLL